MYRLKELTFVEYKKFIRSCDPPKMTRLIGFLFDSEHLLKGCLWNIWTQELDHHFVKVKYAIQSSRSINDIIKENIVQHILDHAFDAKKLIDELVKRSERGLVPKKSNKSLTGSYSRSLNTIISELINLIFSRTSTFSSDKT